MVFEFVLGILIVVAIGAFLLVMVQVPQTHRAVKERFGKFVEFFEPGLHFKIPFVERVEMINITEQLVDATSQEIITKDNLNAGVDAQVYFKVKDDEESVKKAFYNVYNVEVQIVALARTTLRNVIGTMNFSEVNSNRNAINKDLFTVLSKETKNWGIDIVRTELKEITPPKDVQETMNKVLKAQNEKVAAIDYATAAETEADGFRRAEIKKADGQMQATILRAKGDAEAIKLVNESAQKYFTGNAVTLKRLQVAETSLKDNTKIIVPAGSDLINIVGEMDAPSTKRAAIAVATKRERE